MTSNYWASTQYNDWLLSRSQIALARAEDLEYATSADELFALRIWLINCISSLTKRLSMRQRITATAIVFFNRFYTCSPGNSLSSTDPALVATACVYVAAKVEETPIHIRNVVQEASKLWAELGHFNISNDIATLAEMEFYLLEDLQFHLVIYHPYRSLVAIANSVGKGTMQRSTNRTTLETWSKVIGATSSLSNSTTPMQQDQNSTLSGYLLGSDLNTANFMDTDLAFGSSADGLTGKSEDMANKSAQSTREQEQKRALEDAMEERHRLLLFSGDDDMPLAQLEELDEQVLQMTWFVLNDAYRTDVLLLFPPHLVAVASIFLALVLHDPSREKMLKSKKWMDERREMIGKAMKNADAEIAVKSPASDVLADQSKESRVNSPSAALSPPKQQQQQPLQPSTNISNTSKPPLRGLASLPPRPSHLPPRPAVGPSTNQSSNPSTPIGTPKPADSTMRGSPIPNGNAMKNNNEDQAKSKISSMFSMPVPPPDAMTFLAALNVDLNSVGEIVQEMIGLYQFWSREGQEEGVVDFNDGAGMFKILTRMRESRRIDLLQNGPGW